MPIVLRDLMALADITDDQTIKLYDVMIVKIKKQFVLTSLETGTASRGSAREIIFNLRVTDHVIIRLNKILDDSINSCSHVNDCMNIIDSTHHEYYGGRLDTTVLGKGKLLVKQPARIGGFDIESNNTIAFWTINDFSTLSNR